MNLYEILHISQDAPVEIIKMAYKGLAQKYHPDRYKGDDANEIMVKIREAYETLVDPEKRKNYDQFLAEQARRKHQQEEYVRKQHQEEFIRSQRENFKREANSSTQSQTKGAASSEATKDFNINLSIKVPKNFSIFGPFIKLFEWLKSKKRVFIKIIAACFTLYLLALVGFVASNYAESLNSNGNEEQTA
ncbi:MAG: DnaJ domain-containing protein, partial [Acinetobacter sp.]|uniref:J domain-containing protein n=1 Tax=Acinetobacter sp. TaxID=472 RepID=UPI003D042E09